jgi:helix-turn-helix protein
MKAQKTQTEAIKASEEAPKTVKVRSITIGDKEYKITTTNELYDPKTKELVGRYNPLTNTIEEIEEDDEDEEDEEEVGTEDEAEAEEEKYEN